MHFYLHSQHSLCLMTFHDLEVKKMRLDTNIVPQMQAPLQLVCTRLSKHTCIAVPNIPEIKPFVQQSLV